MTEQTMKDASEYAPVVVVGGFADLVSEALKPVEDHLSYDRVMETEYARVRNERLSTMLIVANEQAEKARLGELLAWGIARDEEVEALRKRVTMTCNEVREWLKLLEESMEYSEARLTQEIASAKKSHEVIRQQLLATAARMREHALHVPRVRDHVWALTDGRCFYCSVALVREVVDAADKPRHFHIDHIVPKEKGGPDHLCNYVPSCASCNISKKHRAFAEFYLGKNRSPDLTLIEGGLSDAVRGALG